MEVLKTRVSEVVGCHEQRSTPGLYLKVMIVFAWYFLSYLGLFYSTSSVLSLLLCVSMGLATAGVGFNIFHDSVHGSFSYQRWVNRTYAFLSCSFIGPSHLIWRHKHNFLHHQYTNVRDWDDDLETRGALRLYPTQPWEPKFRYQHFYAPIVYAMTTMEWVFIRDFVRYFSGQMGPKQKLPKLKVSDHLEFWSSKLIYFAFAVVVPLMYFPLKKFLVGFLIVHLVASVVLAVIFQLAHVMEDCQYPLQCPKTGNLEMDWAHLQLATTINFAPKNRLLSWYCGGLNFQVEHHLLPGVCHIHYKKLSPIVEATAKEFGFPYLSLDTHGQAIRSHYEMLKKFSMPSPA